MGKLKTDDTSKPTPKNKVSVLFMLSLAVILAVIGISSWSFFGKHNDKHAAPVITASTAIDASVEAIPQLPPESDITETPTDISTEEASASIAPEPVAPVPASPQVTTPPPDPEELADVMVDAPESLPSPTDIVPLHSATDEETDTESINQPELPAPSTEPEVTEHILTPVDKPGENEIETSEETLKNLPPPTLPIPQDEASELEQETTKTAEEPDAKSEEIISSGIIPPWRAYAAAFNYADDRPRIAIVISEAGVNPSRAREAIESLPAAVTLGFNPYGQNLQELVDQARDAGHEVLLQLPMEPVGYPRIDPGPQAMRTDLDEGENLARLDWALDRFTGYAGVTNQMGSKFTATTNSIRPVLTVLKEKAVFYLDSRTASNSVAAEIADDLDIPVAINNRFLDHKADAALIDVRLAELESIAQRTGSAIGIAYPHSETFRHLSDWAGTLDQKGLVLAPVSALIKRQE
ncbi:divergent polysaccharide deacetylase family protein [Sneathiella sp.]|uniref:divergent polysaccharide deacetylase family protein n=1 Tax=Sneathiella sp. TaxID=1964365 RepID=UPI00262EC109|nr:divergent polysaccharide deacetylase family protein [Sneathiella sp.]MDF2366527.1 divergent polysaccharide deacetylase family protein [Sneathiella sp.]